jgi:hypothetical protein
MYVEYTMAIGNLLELLIQLAGDRFPTPLTMVIHG